MRGRSARRGSRRADGRRRTRGAAIALVAFVLLAGAFLVGAEGVETDRASSPPVLEKAMLTAEVRRGSLGDVVLGSVQVEALSETSVQAPDLPDGFRPIVSRLSVREGREVRQGQLLAAVAGRPLIMLAGDVPAYRPLALGSKGSDVGQLQRALIARGYWIGDPTGTYGRGTAQAVWDLYREAGFEPVGTDGEPIEEPVKAAVPLGEVVFVRDGRGQVIDVQVVKGSLVEGDLFSIAQGETLVASLPPDDIERVEVGMPADVSFTNGRKLSARVAAVQSRVPMTSFPDGSASESSGVPAPAGPSEAERVVVLRSKALSRRLLGATGEVVITTDQIKDTLIVPLTAMYSDAQGHLWVMKAEEGGIVRIAVRVELSVFGEAAITPLGGGKLTEQDRVLLDANNPS